MTAFDPSDRLHHFERDLREALRDEAGLGRPDYLPDVLVRTVVSRQRPAWRFPSRWLPMSVIMSRVAAAPRVPRWIPAMVALILIILAGAVLLAGSRSRLPAPFGRAANGLVAYARDGDIVTVDPVTGASNAIVTGPEYDMDPVFSRDGTRLAFVRRDANGNHLYVVAADGTGLTMVTPDRKDFIASYSFSPDGREIAFTSEGTARQKSSSQLWIAEANGGGVRQIDAGMENVWDPSWRPPDGAEIIFAGSPSAGDGDGLYAADPKTGAVRRILAPANGIGLDRPAVSPDGSRIAYAASLPSDVGRNTDVVRVVGSDGSGDRALPMPAAATFQDAPVWSNDGTRLVIVRGYDTVNQDIALAIVPADGSGAGVETKHGLTGCCDNVMEWAPNDGSILLLPEDPLGLLAGHLLIDPSTGTVTPTSWGATSLPTWQRRAP